MTKDEAEAKIDGLLRAMEDLKFAQNMRRGGDECDARESIKQRRADLVAALTSPQGVPGWRHIANEWADAATNGLQWLRNVKDGISKPDDGIDCMTRNIQRIQSLPRPPMPGLGAAPPAPGVSVAAAVAAEREAIAAKLDARAEALQSAARAGLGSMFAAQTAFELGDQAAAIRARGQGGAT